MNNTVKFEGMASTKYFVNFKVFEKYSENICLMSLKIKQKVAINLKSDEGGSREISPCAFLKTAKPMSLLI